VSIGRGLHRAAVSAFDLECKFRCTCHRDQLFARTLRAKYVLKEKVTCGGGSCIAGGFWRSDAVVVAAESQTLTLRFSHQPLDMFLRVFLSMGFAPQSSCAWHDVKMAFVFPDERWLPKSILCLRDYNLNKFGMT